MVHDNLKVRIVANDGLQQLITILDISYSVLPNKRAYARSCSRKKIPLCTNLLGTMHGPCILFFQKKFKIQKIIFTKNVDNPPVIIVIYVCIVIIHRS